MKKATVVKKAECTNVELSGADILRLLKDNFVIPAEAALQSIYFRVPSGGDYSGQEVEISSEDPVFVEVEVLTEEDQ
jgi:hypothetical protein